MQDNDFITKEDFEKIYLLVGDKDMYLQEKDDEYFGQLANVYYILRQSGSTINKTELIEF